MIIDHLICEVVLHQIVDVFIMVGLGGTEERRTAALISEELKKDWREYASLEASVDWARSVRDLISAHWFSKVVKWSLDIVLGSIYMLISSLNWLWMFKFVGSN